MEKSRIFIVEDHQMMREAYQLLFEMEPDLEVCGSAATGEEALLALQTTETDLVLVDVSLPGISGIELVKLLQASYPHLPTLVISGHDEMVYADQALRAGASGYLDKKGVSHIMLDAIRQVLGGDTYNQRTTS
jgi:DNA-binding NarL/FixJ family response regulator